MTRRSPVLPVLLAPLALLVPLALGAPLLGCGKYGPPVRPGSPGVGAPAAPPAEECPDPQPDDAQDRDRRPESPRP